METATCDALNALREALCHEEEGLSFYRNAAERTIDEKGAAMYAALAEEAQARLALIQRQIAQLEAGGAWDLPECVFACQANLEEPLYPRGDKGLHESVDLYSNALNALEFGLQAANNSYALYASHAANATVPQAKALYHYLAQEARNQFNLLMSNYESLNAHGGWV